MERIIFSSNQNIGEGESNFDEKNVEEVFNLCSTEQSCIHIEITSYKIGTLFCCYIFPDRSGVKKWTGLFQGSLNFGATKLTQCTCGSIFRFDL